MPIMSKQKHPLALKFRAIQGLIVDGKRALAIGNCGEAVRVVTHAYELRGEAEGYAQALREAKGRKGRSVAGVIDKRTAGLPQLKVAVARACSLRG